MLKTIRYLLFIQFVIVILVSCEKEIQLTDDIYYSDRINNIQLSSVVGFMPPFNQNCDSIPIPSDSIVLYYLDLDSNSITDYEIIVEHGIYHDLVGGHCVGPFTYRIWINGLNGAEVAVDTLYNIIISQQDSTELISESLSWHNEGILSLHGDYPGLYFSVVYMTKEYIPLKLNNKFGWLRYSPVEYNGVRFIDYAYNLTEGNSIYSGQRF